MLNLRLGKNYSDVLRVVKQLQPSSRVDRNHHRLLQPSGFNRFKSDASSPNRNDGNNTRNNEKLHPIFSSTQSAPPPSFKTDPYPIPLQNPNHPTTQKNSQSTIEFDQEIYHQLDQLKKIDDKHLEAYHDDSPDHLNTHQSSSTTDRLRSRLIYQSRKRGIVEIELLLSTFVETQNWLKDWDLSRLTQYSRLLMLPDWDLYYYLVKKQDPPSGSEFFNSDLLHQLRIHTSNSSKEVRIMPSLQT